MPERESCRFHVTCRAPLLDDPRRRDYHGHSKSVQRGRELILSLRALGWARALCGDCFRPGGSYSIESPALVSGVAFYRRDQIWDEICAALKLDVDVGPGVLGADSEGDEAVVE